MLPLLVSRYNIGVTVREKDFKNKKEVFCLSVKGLCGSSFHGIIIVTIGEGDKHNACV